MKFNCLAQEATRLEQALKVQGNKLCPDTTLEAFPGAHP